ncbi:sugar transferase [Kytococcus sp. HMSC28H12]|uniref:sugar transferase n=1 Tax=Kytococcus sp. HMSC28H12 TaxID=1581067 RepID=UPI0008A51769|nr:sugar transferase [Kytococcus sp. HMSC28H12]OFS15019.1 sugar transferase [Kytococcus sp. HMSC28H12]
MNPQRVLDVTASAAGLVALAPVMGVAALAVKLDSPGPVFFRQARVGKDGLPFRIHKFRTMRSDVVGANVSTTGDARITRVGKVLRKSKIDELPQLIDVLRGDMALVGPRPEVPEFVRQWDPVRREVILSVRPGITDPASIELRNEADELADVEDPHRHYVEVLLPRKTAMYVDYVRNRSLAGDVRLILRTLGVVATS